MHITKQKKAIWKGYILYESNYMKFWKRQNLMETVKKKSVVSRGWGRGERWIGRAQRILGQWKFSVWYCNDGYMSLHICLAHWICLLHIECVTPRLNPKVKINYGLWVIMMCQCRFINCNNVHLLEDVDNRRRWCVWGRGIKKFSVPSSQFVCEPKTAQKNIVFKKKTARKGKERTGLALEQKRPFHQPR